MYHSTSTSGQDGPPHLGMIYREVVRAQFDYLANGVAADLTRIARRAYTKGLIIRPTLQNATNQATNESDRATGLVSAIQQKIGISVEAFYVFLEILREDPVVSELADTLTKDLEKLMAQKRPSRGDRAGGQPGEGGGGADGKDGASAMEAVEHLTTRPGISLQQAIDNGGTELGLSTPILGTRGWDGHRERGCMSGTGGTPWDCPLPSPGD